MDKISDVTVGDCKDSKYIKPRRIHYTQNGVPKIWDAMKVHDGVVILLFNTSRNVFIFVRQFRPAIYLNSVHVESTDEGAGAGRVDTGRYPGSLGMTLELCAGIVDKSGALPEIARAEILEECGYDVPVDQIRKISSCRGGVGTSGSMIHMYYAEVTDAMKVGPGGGLVSEGEMIEVVEYTVEQARSLMTDETVNKVHALLFALYWFFDKIWPELSQKAKI
ncbi:uridine diphosphate glucose pyrophosphatase NUDT14 [Aplysia californica]|uniref:Uridine diphosphate glucose pyrophosphatase NUDT14 n=1 Tax=Aplysia californica TaxID=6500 RepID=A0ABM0JY79_APLCA|nr:uridine diphosphate glucose pyrophosphatase NUDT14 [Aplysia californica]